MSEQSVPIWIPDEKEIKKTNIFDCMKSVNINNYKDFHVWSYSFPEAFWKLITEKLGIVFDKSYEKIMDVSDGIEAVQWFTGAKMNIINSCFHHKPSCPAIIFRNKNGEDQSLSYEMLEREVKRFSKSLVAKNIKKGDAVAIIMPMTIESVIAYLGIINAGCVVVSIPDSSVVEEIKKRFDIANVKAVITQDKIVWRHQNVHPLYEKVVSAEAPITIVVSTENNLPSLRKEDLLWKDFLREDEDFKTVLCDPADHTNILFSSGTTAEPKGIPWTHTTPIKCGSDAYLHHNIKPSDILAWPTNLGWMMGPWLLYAAFLNKATVAIYEGTPTEREFGEFIQDKKVTMLGLVPSIVKSWRASRCMEGLNWQHLKVFSSSGEPSNQEDMVYLMSLAGNKPIIEYCGGTEIGGAYITSTLTLPILPARFNTPTLGLNFTILESEVAIIPPSIGLSTELINKNHHDVYFAGMPLSSEGKRLRRHGDEISLDKEGFYTIIGRTDDTMKLNGIKTSAAEIENVLAHLPEIIETAAIAVAPKTGGPSQLIIYAVMKDKSKAVDTEKLKKQMQAEISNHLNPFFKIHEVILIDTLPRTYSNKMQRRKLREAYKNQFLSK